MAALEVFGDRSVKRLLERDPRGMTLDPADLAAQSFQPFRSDEKPLPLPEDQAGTVDPATARADVGDHDVIDETRK